MSKQFESTQPDTDYLVSVATRNKYSVLFVPSDAIPVSWMLAKGVKYVVFIHDPRLWETPESLLIAVGSRHSFAEALSKCLEELDLIPPGTFPSNGGYIHIPDHDNNINNEVDAIIKKCQCQNSTRV